MQTLCIMAFARCGSLAQQRCCMLINTHLYGCILAINFALVILAENLYLMTQLLNLHVPKVQGEYKWHVGHAPTMATGALYTCTPHMLHDATCRAAASLGGVHQVPAPWPSA